MSSISRQRGSSSPSSTSPSPAASSSLCPSMSNPISVAASSSPNTGMSESGIRSQMHSLDSNLAALCEHVQSEGWNSRSFSDIVVHAMGSTFHLHRLVLSRSSYFRNMLQGPWKEANAPVVRLQIDDENVNAEAVETALSYLYGHHPRLDDSNAFRVLAAASFLDLQDLCAFCTDFIISELWTENFLSYQAFAESQDYGYHGERVRKACWGYLCRGGAVELRDILPKLSSQTLRTLLTSDELWVPSEEKRFELALSVLVARGVLTEIDSSDALSENTGSDIYASSGMSYLEVQQNNAENIDNNDVIEAVQSIVLDMVDNVTREQAKPHYDTKTNAELSQADSETLTIAKSSPDLWSRGGFSPLSWGGRVVGRRLTKAYPNTDWTNNEEWETFMSIFEGGGIHYCHMPFEDLLESRARLEELGFPCKSVADGLWLQTLLRQQVLTVAADTCKNCSLSLSSCACRQRSVPTPVPYREEQEKSVQDNPNVQNRVVRATMDGLAGIGRGNASSGSGWPASRFMFSRVPFTSRGNQQTEQLEYSAELPTYSSSVDGLNMVVGLSQGMSTNPVPSDHSGRQEDIKEYPVNQQKIAEASPSSSISLDLHTPLQSFPPFRFGVEFEDVQRLTDGQSRHSNEVFYAGSLWKISVQAFNDEDPRCRRTLGLFLHRRKADDSGPFRKVSLYIDTREKVTARYQLICPAKRGVMILGSLTQAGTLLPKAPKGWGWRTAFLYDELVDLLQGNSFRVKAVVQVV